MKQLTETGREVYGHSDRAINKHAERRYRDQTGKCYVLSRTLDGYPPFFEAYGPYKKDHEGVLPRLMVAGEAYWGSGWGWARALKLFSLQLDAEIVST